MLWEPGTGEIEIYVVCAKFASVSLESENQEMALIFQGLN